MNINTITGIILAGGKATRMGGVAKGLVVVDGKRSIERVAGALGHVTGRTIIIANDNSYDYLGLDVYADIKKELGPAGGLLSGLTHSATRHNLVVACDMPFITPALLKFILDHLDGAKCLVPFFNGRLQPLCAYYSGELTGLLEKSTGKGLVTMRDLADRFGYRKLPVIPGAECYNENLFDNINSPEDFQNAVINDKTTHGS